MGAPLQITSNGPSVLINTRLRSRRNAVALVGKSWCLPGFLGHHMRAQGDIKEIRFGDPLPKRAG